MGRVLDGLGHNTEAQALLREVYELAVKGAGKKSEKAAASLVMLEGVQARGGDVAASLTSFQEAATILEGLGFVKSEIHVHV